MQVVMLASGSNVHTVRWANALADRGLEIHLFSLHPFCAQLSSNVHCHRLRWARPLGYLLCAGELRRRLAELDPMLLHTHYASGYGTLGRRCGFRPQILSVWGSDVLLFPNRSPMHRRLIERNLTNADLVCSTSHSMAATTKTIAGRLPRLEITPFGIDVNQFSPTVNSEFTDELVVGTVKTLDHNYGIDLLLRAFQKARASLVHTNPSVAERMRLQIVGGGRCRRELEQLCQLLGLSAVTEFVGPVSHRDVPKYLRRFSVYCALSRSESFGVAVLEASSCGVPVVVSDVGGLPEVVLDGATGTVVASEDVDAAAEAIVRIVSDQHLGTAIGKAGRQHVLGHYTWEESVDKMMAIYSQFAPPSTVGKAA